MHPGTATRVYSHSLNHQLTAFQIIVSISFHVRITQHTRRPVPIPLIKINLIGDVHCNLLHLKRLLPFSLYFTHSANTKNKIVFIWLTTIRFSRSVCTVIQIYSIFLYANIYEMQKYEIWTLNNERGPTKERLWPNKLAHQTIINRKRGGRGVTVQRKRPLCFRYFSPKKKERNQQQRWNIVVKAYTMRNTFERRRHLSFVP